MKNFPAIVLLATLASACSPPEETNDPEKVAERASPSPVTEAPQLIEPGKAGTGDHFRALATLPEKHNRPTKKTVKILKEELLFQRAMQTYLWAMPLLNTMGMKDGSEEKFGAGYNVLPIWKKRLDAKTRITTPNSDVIYAMGYVDLSKTGPLVYEAPPLLQSILLDFWQRPIPMDGGEYFGDIGFFGPDQGKGGEFLILPPGYEGDVPDGYFVYRSGTNNVFLFLRAFFKDPNDLAPAVERLEQSKIYPLGEKDSAKPMEFPDASGMAINMLPRSDATAFEQLKYLVDTEGANLAGADWLGMLASIGIVPGQPFEPDARTRKILNQAAKAAYKASRAIGFQEKVGELSFRVYPDRQWLNPFADGTPDNPGGSKDVTWKHTEHGYRDLDARIWMFTNYYSLSPGMISQTPGKGAMYMIAFTDSDGAPLSGASNYRLHLPRDVPAANFWSLTLYEAENGSGLDNGQPLPSRGSLDKLEQNPDGSTTLYLGPKAPPGKEANWLATPADRGYFAILRLYSPTEPAINKSWKPGDIEKGWETEAAAQ